MLDSLFFIPSTTPPPAETMTKGGHFHPGSGGRLSALPITTSPTYP
ncbi:MAG: hypothetical protein ACI31F_07930 [Muribaculaceae bacterium]